MPAGRLGPPSPLPKLTGGLPYCLQDDYDRQRMVRSFKVAVLENEFLRATFLLDLGGRMWSLYHKPTQRQLLHVNPVFQPADVAIRNAWFAGGVEWNVGLHGHSPFTCSPLFAARAADEDGSPVLRLWEFERARAVPFQIDAYLPDGSSVLLVRVCIVNPHEHETPMYWWSNVAAPEQQGGRVLAPADAACHHDYSAQHKLVDLPLPVWNGVDQTYPTQQPAAGDCYFHIQPHQRPWIAALDVDGCGLIHTSTQRMMGRKLFYWGMEAGGRRWQEFLCDPQHPYIEIQGGLTATQGEYLPMPARATWQWTEAYGLMQSDAELAHGPDWPAAWQHVDERLERLIPAERLDAELKRTGPIFDRPPDEMLHTASGWGALEQRRRLCAGQPPMCVGGICFDQRTLDDEQAPWLQPLEDGVLAEHDPARPPDSWITQAPWRAMLERSVDDGRGDHWLTHLHLGVMFWHDGDRDAAKEAWRRSIERVPSAWAYRFLAIAAARHDEAVDEAAGLYLQACRLAPPMRRLVIEAAHALIRARRADAAVELIESLERADQMHGRVQLLRARAAIAAGDADTAERIISVGVEVPDVAEGEMSLTAVWYDLHCLKIAQREHVPVDEALRQRVRRQFPPPTHLDFGASAYEIRSDL